MAVDAWSVLRALWLFLPVYVANMSPVFSAKLFPKWKRPIDGGRMAKDGNRMLGDGKTWRGLVGGGIAAGAAAVGIAFLAPHFPGGIVAGWDFGLGGISGASGAVTTPGCEGGCASTWTTGTAVAAIFAFGFVSGFLALVGDATESYLKRRTGRERGAPWFPFDQLDFVVFGLLGMLIASPLLPDGWVLAAMFHDWLILATILVLTPGLHLLINRIGYWMGLKEVPW